jgi:hypothetical protein
MVSVAQRKKLLVAITTLAAGVLLRRRRRPRSLIWQRQPREACNVGLADRRDKFIHHTDSFCRQQSESSEQSSRESRFLSYLRALSPCTIYCYPVFTFLLCVWSYALSFTLVRTAGQLPEL